MNDKIPALRNWNSDAIEAVGKDLGIDVDKPTQDWPYEVANDVDIQLYINQYDIETDEDKKFVLMDMIIEANTNQISRQLLLDFWEETKERLTTNFTLHEYQIYYWCAFDELRLADAWDISPMMRTLWKELSL